MGFGARPWRPLAATCSAFNVGWWASIDSVSAHSSGVCIIGASALAHRQHAMLSKKCKYALKALVRLGKEYGRGNLLTDDIARHEHIPKKFLELILLDLKRCGYVQSKQGAGG